MHDNRLRQQFSIRSRSFAESARWMLDQKLLTAHLELAGKPEAEAGCLDLCCGPGIVGRAFRQRGWQVSGIDLTPEMTEEAEKHFPAVTGPVEAMPLADNRFDLAVLRQSFMLVRGPEALSEIHRVLRPGGCFILSQSVAFGPGDEDQYRQIQEARHINMTSYYRDQDLLSALEEQGFSIITRAYLTVRESVDHWLRAAPELNDRQRGAIRKLISHAPASYKAAHRVEEINGELFEDWNWLIIRARAEKSEDNQGETG